MKKLISKMTTVAAVVATSALMIGCGGGEGEEKDDGQGDANVDDPGQTNSPEGGAPEGGGDGN
tara:strand:- start:572 stop:760 length:189 start_codon:yes stop_codon:yes gene_type:complete